jgi:hypothetical protein
MQADTSLAKKSGHFNVLTTGKTEEAEWAEIVASIVQAYTCNTPGY